VNFTERLWDYDSCAEAQLKIWLARHLLASENSGREVLRVGQPGVLKQLSVNKPVCTGHPEPTQQPLLLK
jgi:hypothetical protein